jgi:HK97 family phage portal protein
MNIFKSFSNLIKSDKYALYRSVGGSSSFAISPKTALDINEISLYVNKGINKRAEKVGQTQFVLTKGGKTIEKHWVLDLLDRPNSYQTGDQFFKLASIYRDVTGYALIHKVIDGVFNKQVKELRLLNPAYTEINLNADKTFIQSFTYTDINSGISETVAFEECIYWCNPDPKNDIYGLSLLKAGIRSIDTDLQLVERQNSILKNGGVIDGVFNFKNNLTAEQLKNLKQGYKDEYTKSSASGTPLFLGGDATYQRVGLNMQELAYLESKKLYIDDMVVITGVPLAILGLTSDQSFANAETAHKIFLRETIKPILEDLVNTLDWRLVPMDMDLSFIDPTPEDTETKLKLLETGNKVGALTLNEKRNMLGLEPIKGGDEISEPEPIEKKSILIHPLRNKAFRHQYHGIYVKSLEAKSNKFKKEVEKYFQDQKKRLVEHLSGKKAFKKKDLFSEVFNIDTEISIANTLSTTLKAIIIEAGQETMDLFNMGQKFNYSTAIDTFLDKRVAFFTEKINETTADELQEVFTDWFSNDETYSQLIERIERTYDEFETYRAERIANTETAMAMQESKSEAYYQMQIPIKIWSWAPGLKGGVRDDHASIDGEEVPLNGVFSNGMKHPLDSSADASEVINCQCSI